MLLPTPLFAAVVLYGLVTQERFPVAQATWATFSPVALQAAYWFWIQRFSLKSAYGIPLLGAGLFSLVLGLITYAAGLLVHRGEDMAYLAGGLGLVLLLFTWRWSFRNYEQD